MKPSHIDTRILHVGRNPHQFGGVVNTPVYRTSTVLAPTLADWEHEKRAQAAGDDHHTYGRFGTPTTRSLEKAIAELEGGAHALVYPSGLAACTHALMAFLSAGDHVLLSDSVYGPTRSFACNVLRRFGVEVDFYDPVVGAGIEQLMRINTRVVYTEAPGSLTFEMQDIPAIAEVAHRHGAVVIMDNTWASPLYFKPFEHGVDVSIQAATKYIVGHSDALLGTVTANEAAWNQLKQSTYEFGQTASPDDIYLALRGIRTMALRLERHWENGVQLADWLARQPLVETVLHPALPGDRGHAIWKRDFKGASGLFAMVLKPVSRDALAAFVDHLELFGLGLSWGGYESLIMPFNPAEGRTVTEWEYPGPTVRIHAGLEHIDDLKADLNAGFLRMAAALDRSTPMPAEPDCEPAGRCMPQGGHEDAELRGIAKA